MTEKQWGYWEQYIQELMVAMRIDARLTLDREPCHEDFYAKCAPDPRIHHIRIHLCKEWLDRKSEDQRRDLTHELLHYFTAPMGEMIQNDLGELVGKPLATALWDRFDYHEEEAVDALSRVLCEFMPLPKGER